MRILLIEDDVPTSDGLRAGLSKMGFSINQFIEGRRGKEALYNAPYGAITLNLTLPDIDERDILREWRANGRRGPVLILTTRGALTERVEGLRLGADDYLYKPLALIEAVARLGALVCRASDQANNALYHGQVALDPGALVVTTAGEPLSLKPKEFVLLELLMRSKGCVLPRKLIEEKLYTQDENTSSNAVEVHVRHLRRKSSNGFVRTVHGIGYTLGDVWNSHNASACESG